MVCVLVTSGGWGDLWAFQTKNDAYMHPLHQYGDALLTRPWDVCDQYCMFDWPRLRVFAGMPPIGIGGSPVTPTAFRRLVQEEEAPKILEVLTRLAHPAPTDPAEICRRIVEDRRRLGTVTKRKHDAPAPPVEVTTKAASEKSAPPAPARGPKGVAGSAVISFGVDKEGNSYGPEVNNPKKEGSKTRTRFALYREGMTVDQALAAGITTADLVYDRDHGFVKFGAGEPEAAAVEEFAESDGVEDEVSEDAEVDEDAEVE